MPNYASIRKVRQLALRDGDVIVVTVIGAPPRDLLVELRERIYDEVLAPLGIHAAVVVVDDNLDVALLDDDRAERIRQILREPDAT